MNAAHEIRMGIYYRNSYDSGWTSRESGIVIGTVRLIDDQLYYAWTIHEGGWWDKDETLWLRLSARQLQGKCELPSERLREELNTNAA